MIPSSNNSSLGSRNVLFLRWLADSGTPLGGLHHPGQPGPEPGQGGRELRKRKTQQNRQCITGCFQFSIENNKRCFQKYSYENISHKASVNNTEIKQNPTNSQKEN